MTEATIKTDPDGSLASKNDRLPLPIAFAGVGLLVSVTLPGGLSGGQGFLVGLAIGVTATVIAVGFSQTRKPAATARLTVVCPHCTREIEVSVSHVKTRESVESTRSLSRTERDDVSIW